MEYSNYCYALLDDNLIIYSKINGKIRLRPPIGPKKKYLFDEVLILSSKQDSDFPLGMIDIENKRWIEENYPKLGIHDHRAYFDYIYLSSDLAELKGKKFRKIRNRLNKFEKNYNFTIEKITRNNEKEINEFLDRWCLWKDCESDPILEYEKRAILRSMKYFYKLNLSGLAIRINDSIEAISVFEKMDDDTALIHYEKGSPYYDGIYKAINQRTAEELQNKYLYINRESDMNIAGLRKAKMSYRPHHFIEVYHIPKKNIIL
jgi:hypothetical protein